MKMTIIDNDQSKLLSELDLKLGDFVMTNSLNEIFVVSEEFETLQPKYLTNLHNGFVYKIADCKTAKGYKLDIDIVAKKV